MQIGIYPGSFDPLTNGHLDIIERASKFCDKLVIAVAHNKEKNPIFSIQERLEILDKCCINKDKIEIVHFEGLLADYCKKKVPAVLLSGDHKKIEQWRLRQAVKITKQRRPDLIK